MNAVRHGSRPALWAEIALGLLLAAFLILLGARCARSGTFFIGEAASYSLTTVSLVNDGNGFISGQEIELARAWFPDWTDGYEGFRGSGYTVDGGIVPWYFPTYSAFCVPALLILQALGLPLYNAFCYTNFGLYALLLVLVFADRRRLSLGQRAALTVLLGVNPVLFYFVWASAETFLFVFVALACLCWVTGRRRRAALCISLAGHMNPCALAFGLVMIAEYLVRLWRQSPARHRIAGCLRQWKDVALYALCYVPALIPFAYNYVICGSINLTASHSAEVASFADGTVARQLLAYFTDLNFGLLPYFAPLMALCLVLGAAAIARRQWRYWLLLLGMTAMIFGCAFMANINCGMAGIARYNAWAAAAMAVAAGYFLPVLAGGRVLRVAGAAAAGLCCVYTGAVILWYGGLDATQKVSYLYATPMAEFVVARWPWLYRPLTSTFWARANTSPGSDFAYYRDDNLHLRKLCVSAADRNAVMAAVDSADPAALEWLDARLAGLGDEPEYVDIPPRYSLYVARRTIPAPDNSLTVRGVYDSDARAFDTLPQAGYSMTGPGEDLGAGHYTVTLHCEASDPCQAQFQITCGSADEMQILAYAPLTPEADTVSLALELPVPIEDVDYRVYQEEGTSLRLYSVEVLRDR